MVREIKYINHSVRNAFSYAAPYLILNFLFDFTMSPERLLFGLATIIIGYAAVYFLNDYTDQVDDVKNNKVNLYNIINNYGKFFLFGISCIVFGLVGSFLLSPKATLLLLFLYALNFLYSVKPFRFRNKFWLREITLFIINITKWYFALLLMGFEPTKSPLSIMLMASSLLAGLTVVYKRHTDNRNANNVLYVFGAIGILSWGASLWMYPKTVLLFGPIVPMFVYFHFKYKNKPIPTSKYILAYIVYFSLALITTKYLSL